MTLATLDEHLELVQQMGKLNDILIGLRETSLPGAQVITGMPHAPGVKDNVGYFAVQIAHISKMMDDLQKQIDASEASIKPWIDAIDDGTIHTIFTLRFMYGMAWKAVATVIRGNTEESVKRMCYRYLNAQNSEFVPS